VWELSWLASPAWPACCGAVNYFLQAVDPGLNRWSPGAPGAVAGCACCIPALRAARVEPMEALQK
jgi:hypothetical protein